MNLTRDAVGELMALALSRPGQTQRQPPYIAVAGRVPRHKDLKEPQYLALAILKTGNATIWTEEPLTENGILGELVSLCLGQLLVLNLHAFHSMTVEPGNVFIAAYGSGDTVEAAEQALKEVMYGQ